MKFLSLFKVYLKSSYRIHPKLHMSIAWSYYRSTKHTSGARYQRDPICIDVHLFKLFLLVWSFFSKVEINYFSPFTFLKLFLHFIAVRSRMVMVLKPWRSEQDAGILLERPKSHILMLNSLVINIFDGFNDYMDVISMLYSAFGSFCLV